MKFLFYFTEIAIKDDLHLVTALKGLQPSFILARNSCPNSTVAKVGMLARPLFPLQPAAPETTTDE